MTESLDYVPEGCETMSKPSCLPYEESNETSFFVADVEYFTLKLEHAVYLPDLRDSIPGSSLSGKLLSAKDEEIDPCARESTDILSG